MPIRWRTADQRYDRCLFDAVEHSFCAGPRFVGERRCKTSGVVPIGDTFHLAVVPADCLRRREYGHPLVEVLQREDPAPRSRRQLLACLQLPQLLDISVPELETGRTSRFDLHPNA